MVLKQLSYESELQSVKNSLELLPIHQAENLFNLWLEFERGTSPEARYARCLDALAPLMNHLWVAEDNDNPSQLSRTQVLSKKAFIEKESPELWQMTLELLDSSVKKGLYLAD